MILDVTLNKVGKNPINERMTAGFSAITSIKRSDFGMTAFLPNVGDEVAIEIGAEAYKPDTADKAKQEGNNASKKQ